MFKFYLSSLLLEFESKLNHWQKVAYFGSKSFRKKHVTCTLSFQETLEASASLFYITEHGRMVYNEAISLSFAACVTRKTGK